MDHRNWLILVFVKSALHVCVYCMCVYVHVSVRVSVRAVTLMLPGSKALLRRLSDVTFAEGEFKPATLTVHV